jgi:hypothetical protein
MFRIALLPDLFVLLGVAGAALETASALPSQEIRRMLLRLGRTHPAGRRFRS